MSDEKTTSERRQEFQVTQLDESLFAPLKDRTTDGSLKPFIEEFEKLQQVLRKSHENEKQLIQKCRSLTEAIEGSTVKSETLSKQQEDNLSTIDSLNEKIKDQKKKKVEMQHQMKEKKGETKEMRAEIATLNSRLESVVDELLGESEKKVAKLEKTIQEFALKRDNNRQKLTRLRIENNRLYKQVEEFEELKTREEIEISDLDQTITKYEEEANKEERRKEAIQQKIKDQNLMVLERLTEIEEKEKEIDKLKSDTQNAKIQIEEEELAVHDKAKKHDELADKAKRLKELLLLQKEKNEYAQKELKIMEKEAENKKNQADQQGKEANKKKKLVEALRKKVRTFEDETLEEERIRDEWQQKLEIIKEQISTAQSTFNSNTKQISVCIRQQNLLNQNHVEKAGKIRATEMAISITEGTLKTVQSEVGSYENSIKQQKQIIEQLGEDKETHSYDLNQKQLRHAKLLEKVNEKDLEIISLQKEVIVHESKLKEQEILLETARADRNFYSKALIEQKDEMKDLKRTFEGLLKAIQQLRGEIKVKDRALQDEEFNLQKTEENVTQIKKRIDRTNARIVEWEETVASQDLQIKSLTSAVSETDEKLKYQQKQLNGVVSEQNILNKQLISRNEELEKLYEKLRLQNSMFQKGEQTFKAKCKELRKVQQKRDELLHKYEELQVDKAQYETLKTMIGQMQNELVQEQLKVRALQDELQKPINIHRWRQLMETNAESFGMISRIQKLHKEIISKADEVDQKDSVIQEKERLYVDLRRLLARRPGSEAREQLVIYAQSLREKQLQYEALKHELQIYQARVYEHKYEIEKLQKDLKLVKLAYFAKKREELKRNNNSSIQKSPTTTTPTGVSPGGGGGELTPEDSSLSVMAGDPIFDAQTTSEKQVIMVGRQEAGAADEQKDADGTGKPADGTDGPVDQ